jgi:hypothetical protein
LTGWCSGGGAAVGGTEHDGMMTREKDQIMRSERNTAEGGAIPVGRRALLAGVGAAALVGVARGGALAHDAQVQLGFV